ncbi:hypothetical protein PGTUg99_004028 [Puccinia graminis f. sp. tritici]|uniref:Uncharacterized protein n=1 Tax=Puccinia graminis f. sp. tritici TaxID=56615 RepID=A0A5B0LHE0_PUCGR|nr:hypothetical protein PGTUg99_004028 [Puccinia graminis f. sp. tritici]
MTSSVLNKHRGPEAARTSHTLPRTHRTSIKGGLGCKPHRFKPLTTCPYRRQTCLNHRLDKCYFLERATSIHSLYPRHRLPPLRSLGPVVELLTIPLDISNRLRSSHHRGHRKHPH